MPQREFATDVVRRLREAGFVAYFAGGCVRDLLLGRTAKDYDVATNARPERASAFPPLLPILQPAEDTTDKRR